MATLSGKDIQERLISFHDIGVSLPDVLGQAKQRRVPSALGEALEAGKIVLDPMPVLEDALTSASIDVRLGNIIEMVNIPMEITKIDGQTVIRPYVTWYNRESVAQLLGNDHDRGFQIIKHGVNIKFRLKDGEFIQLPRGVLITPYTLEVVCVPYGLVARMEGRSSLARVGIVPHVASPRIDPGFIGYMTMEVSNVGSGDVCLQQGQRIAALSFDELLTPAQPYHSYKGEAGRFSGQD